MDIILTESQINLIKENIDILHYLKTILSSKNPNKYRREYDAADNEKAQKIIDMVLKVSSKTEDYKNLPITKYISEFFVHKTSIQNDSETLFEYDPDILYYTWNVVILVYFKPIFNFRKTKDVMDQIKKIKEIFETNLKNMGIKEVRTRDGEGEDQIQRFYRINLFLYPHNYNE
jgi:hypothetical protein